MERWFGCIKLSRGREADYDVGSVICCNSAKAGGLGGNTALSTSISLEGPALPGGGILPLLLLSKTASSYHLVYSINQSVT